ncbi:MAG: IS1 family transposase [Magnetococcales bacterium]|nr:IS1 family transposase [Magnetococcales bacterium]
MNPACPKCSDQATVKNGFLYGKQRFKCKPCGYQFTRLTPRGRPSSEKVLAILLYLHGLSLNAIAKLLCLSTPAVLKWVRKFAQDSYQKPEPTGAVVVELDEMWHFLKKTKQNMDLEGLLSRYRSAH